MDKVWVVFFIERYDPNETWDDARRNGSAEPYDIYDTNEEARKISKTLNDGLKAEDQHAVKTIVISMERNKAEAICQ